MIETIDDSNIVDNSCDRSDFLIYSNSHGHFMIAHDLDYINIQNNLLQNFQRFCDARNML